MASERDREIWDDATNAVCQAMQEQNMCNCPDGDCLAAKIDFSPEKIATATRPAPVATDTGLVTVGYVTPGWLAKHCSAHTITAQPTPAWTEAVVTRSQAEELLAAEIRRERDLAEKQLSEVVDRMSDDYLALKADNAAKDAELKAAKEYGDKWFKYYSDLREPFELSEIERRKLETQLAAAEKRAELAEMSSSALLIKLKRTQHISRNRLLRLRNLRHKIIFMMKDIETCFNANRYDVAMIRIRELIRWEIKF